MTSPRGCGNLEHQGGPSQGGHALVADRDLLERVESLSDEDRSSFRFSMGPLELLFDGFVGMRLNEHALHTWDIEVTIDPIATVPAESTAHIVDNLELIARFTAKPTGNTGAIAVRTDQPRRTSPSNSLPMRSPSEREMDRASPISNFRPGFVRLTYGDWIRLNPEHRSGLRCVGGVAPGLPGSIEDPWAGHAELTEPPAFATIGQPPTTPRSFPVLAALCPTNPVWIQGVDATASANASHGAIKSSVFRGLVLSERAILSRSRWV